MVWERAILYTGVIMVSLCVFVDTAYAKNSNTGNWYVFNDSHVEQVPEDRVVVSVGSSIWRLCTAFCSYKHCTFVLFLVFS